MSDPGDRTDIDWTVFMVCGYDHNIVRHDGYIRHAIHNHDGLRAERHSHATVCKLAGHCICRLEEYEAEAARMAAERAAP